jgi:SAM-dependent methyltransferase
MACRACSSSDLIEMFDFGKVPLAGGFLDSSEVPTEQHYPLSVHVCRDCALVQIVDPIDPDVLFQDYSFSASTIPGLVKHFESYARWIAERFGPRLVVEFGCNDGVLLTPLKELGIESIGVDVSKNISELARQRGHHVVTGAFTPEIATRVREEYGPADVVTGSNTFAHNADPSAILQAAQELLRPDGVLCLEFMYAGDLYEQVQWDTLYHEHLTFYSLRPLTILLEQNGFHLVHAERAEMHGGSLRVVASPNPKRMPDPSVDELVKYEESLAITSADTWVAFAARTQRSIKVVKEVMSRLSKSSTIWGYGAAGKATMWVNVCEMNYLEGMVDASPLRAGKLMPGTHTPIVSPEEFRSAPTPDLVFVTAWNYLDDIARGESWYPGIWVTPLPSLSFR